MYKAYFVLVSFSLVVFLASCRDDEDIVVTFPGKTVLVYMVADNSLSNDAQINIDSLSAGMSRNNVVGNILVYVDCANETPILMQLIKSGNGVVTRKTIKTYPEQNSVSVSVMSSVLNEVATRFKSDSYGLVLWSHGYGWLPATITTAAQAVSLRWFGLDGSDEMDLPDLVSALKAGPHFDYILFDACFMGGAETAYALRSCTDYLIASPTEVLADGFPYNEMVPSMLGNTKSDYIRMASLFYEHYNASTGYNRSASVSCIKCSELEALAARTKDLISAHAVDLNALNLSSVQCLESYSPHLFFDFGHFIESFTTELERHYFVQQLERTVLYKACTENILSVNGSSSFFSVNHFSGLNTFIPRDATSTKNASYRLLEWYSAAGWNNTKW